MTPEEQKEFNRLKHQRDGLQQTVFDQGDTILLLHKRLDSAAEQVRIMLKEAKR